MNAVTISKTEQIIKDTQPRAFGKVGKVWLGFLIAICIVGCYAYYCQLRDGLVVTAMGDYVSWGIYISNFVFFVAISLVGSLITAIFRLSPEHVLRNQAERTQHSNILYMFNPR